MNVFWKDTEKTILIREASETWTWEEYAKSALKMGEMLKSVHHDVYIILDASRVELVPKDSLSHFSQAHQNIPAYVVMRILVTQNTLLQSLKVAVQKAVPDKFEDFYIVNTMEDAFEKIEQKRLERQ